MRKRSLAFVLALLGVNLSLFAATIVEVNIIHRQLIALHFDDGYVDYHGLGEPRSGETAIVDPLNLQLALQTGQYTLISSNDPNYATAKSPTDIGRKTKATNFTWLCQGWNGNCVNTDPDHAEEHWIYLYLPTPLEDLKTYTLTWGNLATNESSKTIVFFENQSRSEAVHVNLLGYHPSANQKFAYIYHWAGDKGGIDFSPLIGKPFEIWSNNTAVFTGTIQFRADKTNDETGQADDTPERNFLGGDVLECDFSSITADGNYKVYVPGVGTSFPFVIRGSAYNDAFYHSIRGLYHNRSGIALESPYTNFTRPAPHRTGETPGFEGRLKYSTFRAFDLNTIDGSESDKAPIEAEAKGILTDTWGWYQDAGDWDGYYSHTNVPAWLLLLLEDRPNEFVDNTLKLPESGNSLPDVLDEALWLPRCLYRARKEITDKGWSTGGVPGSRIFGDLWGADTPNDIGRGSWMDNDRDWYVLGEDPWMTYKYAGIAAHTSRLTSQNNWIDFDDPEPIDWANEAKTAWIWAQNNTKPGDEDEKNGTRLAHIRMYAAAQLLHLTGDASTYGPVFEQDAALYWPANIEGIGGEDLLLATYAYATLPDNVANATLRQKARDLIDYLANEELVNTANSRACRWGGNYYFPMLIGQATTPLVEGGVLGYLLAKQTDPTKADVYLNRLRTTADYFLGTNPLNMTWITGVGERSPQEIFHLDWWYGGQTNVLPGVTPYGPWRSGDYGPLGPWNHMWAAQFAYPNIDQWPGHERWFSQRTSPLTCEFTVHQNTRQNAVVYGLLSNGLGTVHTQEPGQNTAVPSVSAWFDAASRTLFVKNPDALPLTGIEIISVNGQLAHTEQWGKRTDMALMLPLPGERVPGIYTVQIMVQGKGSKVLQILMR